MVILSCQPLAGQDLDDVFNTGRGKGIINLGFGGQFGGAEATRATAVCYRNKQTGPRGMFFLKIMAMEMAVNNI